MVRIIHFEVEGRPALGFDTGLNAKAFAQAKLAQLITQPGYIVSPEGTVELWKPVGVTDRDGAMIIWGPVFFGVSLSDIIEEPDRNKALDALRSWIRARIVLQEQVENPPYPWPAGAIVADSGTILFPPDGLIKRALDAEGPESWFEGAERWVHPDLSGENAAVFSAGTMLYRIFCGVPPFQNGDINKIRSDIREGVYFPTRLIAPGLNGSIALLIVESIAPNSYFSGKKRDGKQETGADSQDSGQKGKTRPGLRELESVLGPAGSKSADSFFSSINDSELTKIEAERKQYKKRQDLSVNTRRFIYRNTTILCVAVIAMVVLGLTIRSIIKSRNEQPSTAGMTPLEVVEAYYVSFDSLDHTMMEACVTGKAGKGDIDMARNIFVISRVRQAYEMTNPVTSAQQWLDSGSPPVETLVFGITGLSIEELPSSSPDERPVFRAEYTLWVTQGKDSEAGDESAAIKETMDIQHPAEESPLVYPVGTAHIDTITLGLVKDAWRIEQLDRRQIE
ncbi:hypothetical protein [Breznakiella homolactica]|uniref:Protein kinase domain-containing protein n=1 Tax=Breznakiella homolactica TaxID=2798577 RepID=A0A7T7XJA8_9SPIR|nr:hypothetical protein [Breznakiella homolactica]QQO07464.1 hypothetical protein JFL75_10880 [Breznakiella homolactica]